ncbi:MAG: sigma 54-interacting transcriptional regulator [Melioribacteraceae bacterium]|nr:sigma 54-interacting transcriptional regulator [Melioribacteraceae bacterium]
MDLNSKLKDHILDSIGEGVFTVDKNFRINFFNKAAEKITGYKREDIIGRFCKHVFRSKLCYTDCPIAIALKSGRPIYDFESNISTKSGEIKPIKLNSSVLYDEEREPQGGIISFRDMSDYIMIKDIDKEQRFHGIIGHSKQMKEIFELIREISTSDAPVLIHGESGTGKEMIANAIQITSERKGSPYIKVNCSVFPSNLLASELFGHVKGAFTDAIKDRPGRFEIANNGTIFLDEVAEMPLQMQLQLLRVLQEGSFERVGESVTRKIDVRIISATNVNIQHALKKGILREDLYYRLSVIPIHIPPLRERTEDIIPLVQHFLRKLSLMYKKEILDIEDRALDLLLNYRWPGNVRELENVIEYSFVRTNNSNIIDSNKLPANFNENKSASPATFSFKDNTSENNPGHEAVQLISVLEEHHWNKTEAAKKLGIGRTTLWRKMKQLGIDS